MNIRSLAATALVAVGCVAFSQGTMYVIDSSRALSTVDIATGAKTLVGTVSSNAGTTGGLAWDNATGTMYLTSTSLDSLFTLDLNTLTATLVGAYGDSTVVMHGLEWDSSAGVLYGASGVSANNNLYRVSTTTGAATLVGNVGLTSFNNLGFHSGTGVMYMTHGGNDSLYTLNTATATPTLIGPLNGPTNPHGLAYNQDDGRMYLIDSATDNFYWLDLATGNANLIGSMGSGNLLGMAYVPVPEPGTMAVLGLGALALMRRRKKAA
ncbi:MAG: PEP-CTERM sorting domain-containing protein [Fimbriimonadaceae bacterium]